MTRLTKQLVCWPRWLGPCVWATCALAVAGALPAIAQTAAPSEQTAPAERALSAESAPASSPEAPAEQPTPGELPAPPEARAQQISPAERTTPAQTATTETALTNAPVLQRGSGEFVAPPPDPAPPPPPPPADAPRLDITFERAPVGMVVQSLLSDFASASVVIDPRVEGEITIRSQGQLTAQELPDRKSVGLPGS